MIKKALVLVLIILAIPILTVAPAYPVEPTVVDNVWFVAFLIPGQEPGEISWTGEGKILHHEVSLDWLIFQSVPPAPPGSNEIGSMTTVLNYQFNIETGKGNAVLEVVITLDNPEPAENPYGTGTLEGTAITKATTNNAHVNIPGDAAGFVVCTKGTETFANVKLEADLLMDQVGNTPIEFIFFGAHPINNPDGLGVLTYHNLGS